MKENAHAQAIPATVLQQVQTKLNEVTTLLQPYAIPLTPDERRNMLIMGDKTVSFVDKAYDFASQNPGLVPSFLNMAAFGIDKTDATGLHTLLVSARQVEHLIDDTALVAGSEALHSALVFYNSTKLAVAQDIPGAKAIYEELAKRYPGRTRKSQKAAE